jgi:glutaredoxin
MRIIRTGLMFCMLVCLGVTGWASNASLPWFTLDESRQVQLRVDLFLSSTCPHCQKAESFFKKIEATTPWLKINRYIINEDKAALETFNQFLKQQKEYDFAVPSIVFCNTRWIGFGDESTDGQQLLKTMNYCRTQIAKTGELTPATIQALKQISVANWYEANLVTKISAITFIPMMALFDALNPSSVTSILALFAFLFIQKPQKIKLSVILLFLLGAGIAHHIQQSHASFFYQALVMLRIPAALIGLGLLSYVVIFHTQYNSQVKRPLPKTVYLLLVLLVALVIQAYQQNHAPNFSLIFHQWVSLQGFSEARQILYGLLYQIVYLLITGIIAVSLVALARRFVKNLLRVEIFAWNYLLMVSLILIAYPYLFAKFAVTLLIIIVASLSSWISLKRGAGASK